MKQYIKVEDPDNQLTSSEISELSVFIPTNCLCTRESLRKLIRVRVKDYGNTGWNGLWEAIYTTENNQELFEGGQILLNLAYCGIREKWLQRLEDTLCHEYGHHWTMCYALEYIEDALDRRYLLTYYRARNIPRNLLHYTLPTTTMDEWLSCDKEVIAEDFKVLFTPCHKHEMANIPEIGEPSARIKFYLSKLILPPYA